MKQAIKLLMGSMITGALVIFLNYSSSIVQAAANCDSVVQKSDIELGTVCTKTLKIDTGKADWPDGVAPAKVEYSPPTSEWLVRDISNPRVLSASNGRMKDFNQIPPDANFDIRSELDAEYQNLRRTNADFKAAGTIPVKGVPVPVEAQVKYLEELEQRNRDISKVYSMAKSNVARLLMVAEANGVCKASALGKCIDGVGGWYVAEVDVTLVYVGDVQAHLDSIRNAIKNTEELVDDWTSCAQEAQSSSCDPSENKQIEAALQKIGGGGDNQESILPQDQKDSISPTAPTIQTPEVKVGFWGRIINFFKNLFG